MHPSVSVLFLLSIYTSLKDFSNFACDLIPGMNVLFFFLFFPTKTNVGIQKKVLNETVILGILNTGINWGREWGRG